MAKRGDAARQNVMDIICKAFREDFVGIQDKKIYVWAQDGVNGEKIQFAVSITMPKTPIAGGGDNAPSTSSSGGAPATEFTPTELAPEDKAKIEELKKRLGIFD